jgi:DNA-binding protein HU-beta
MNKAQLVGEVLSAGKFPSKASAERATNAVIESLTKGLKKDGTVQLVGFGSFAVTKRKARKGRNPQTGVEIKIKASKSVKFRAGKALKDAVKKTKA